VLPYAVVIGCAALVVLGVMGWYSYSASSTGVRGNVRRFPAGFRVSGRDRWSVGTLVYQADRLVYRRPGPFGRSRDLHWERFDLDVGIGSWIDGQEVWTRLRGIEMVSVPCRYGDQTFELAVSPARYTALRSWLEAGPPGQNAGVA